MSRAVCVSLHDVAPATWPACQRLIAALDQVARVPMTLLVVPDYHHRGAVDKDPDFRCAMTHRLALGDEIAMHGYYHLDDAPPSRNPHELLRRHVYTAGEGEFSSLDCSAARARLESGLTLWKTLDWPVAGFVPPAWLLGKHAWQAFDTLPFVYTSTLRGLYRLPTRTFIASQSLVYSVRSPWRRWASRRWNASLMARLQDNDLLRLSLHPVDALHPDVMRDWQGFLAKALQDRIPMTKLAFMEAFASI